MGLSDHCVCPLDGEACADWQIRLDMRAKVAERDPQSADARLQLSESKLSALVRQDGDRAASTREDLSLKDCDVGREHQCEPDQVHEATKHVSPHA